MTFIYKTFRLNVWLCEDAAFTAGTAAMLNAIDVTLLPLPLDAAGLLVAPSPLDPPSIVMVPAGVKPGRPDCAADSVTAAGVTVELNLDENVLAPPTEPPLDDDNFIA